MNKLRKYIKVILVLVMLIPMMGMSSVYALDKQLTSDIKVDASNYNQYREQLEKVANGDNVIDRTTSKDYTFGTYGRVHIDGWDVNVLSTEVGDDGFHTIKFKAAYGFKLPTVEEGVRFRFAVVESYTTDEETTYTIEGQGNEQDKVGVLTFKPKTSKDAYDATPILVRLVGTSYNETQKNYLSSYVFVTVHHSGIQFTGEEQASGLSFLLDGSRTYLVKKNTPLKVYYLDQKGFKPIETNPSTTGVSYQHDDFTNRYRVIAGKSGDSTGDRLSYDATIFSVKVYNYTKKAWVTTGYYDFYHDNTHVTMPSIGDENVILPGLAVVGYKVQRLMYEPKMANIFSWDTKEVGLDYSIDTKTTDYNVQWTSTGVDGGSDQHRYSSLRLRAGNIFITPLYQNEYTVRFLDYNGTVLDTQTVLKGKDAIAPEEPKRNNYDFTGWDKAFTNIQNNLDIYATYKENIVAPIVPDTEKVKVTFVDYDGTVLKEDNIDKGTSAIAPILSQRDGYRFIGWDKSYENVSEDLVVTALYERVENVVLPEEPTLPTPPTITPPVTTLPTVTPPIEVTPNVVTPIQTPTVPVVRDNNQEVIENTDIPQGNGDTVINDNQTPLAKANGAWALINLICVLLTIIVGFILLVLKHKEADEREDYEVESVQEYKRRRWTKISTFIVSIVSIVVFIVTEDVTLPMQFIDKYTGTMVMILIVQLMVLLIGSKWKKEQKNIQINNG